jgi:hypothetical protein
MTTPLYSIGTWDIDEQAFLPQEDVPAFNLTLFQLRQSMRLLREHGYSCHRYRDEDGGHSDNDAWVRIDRTDGKSEESILLAWKSKIPRRERAQ